MDEFARIRRFWQPLAAGFPGARNLEDDAAILTPAAGHELVVTTDAIVENVHFLENDPPEQIAQKLLRVNLSDLAAKGAEPYAYTLTTALPERIGEAWLERFAAGLAEDQREFGIALAGGDTVSTTGPIVLSVTAFGQVPAGKAVSRGGAQAGDLVFATGTIGAAWLGLQVLQNRLPRSEAAEAWIHRYRLPQPRVKLAALLREVATASIDISDGLIADLDHICAASSLSAKIDAALIPLPSDLPESVTVQELAGGGDDYEIAFTAPPSAVAAIASYCKINDTSISRIGEIHHATPPRTHVYGADGTEITFHKRGWRHVI